MTPAIFREWVAKARRGSRFCYHAGLLMADRQIAAGPDWHRVDAMGDAAWAAWQTGNVALVQERIDDGICRYHAVRI